MYIWLILALLFAALEAVAVLKSLPGLEYVAKPAVMVCLFLWLYSSTGWQGDTRWFGAAILLSLAGDVLLMLPPERLFFFGLVVFLLAHISYIIGFRAELEIINGWSLILLAIIAVNASRILRRIIGAMRARGENKLVVPIVIYGIVISFMLFAAMSTLFDPDWQAGAALLVSAGAALFCVSDAMLAWNKFVSPVTNGRFLIIVLYHLGQVGLIAGVISQFG
jgi:uncharacterized membrane protein YhhN